MPELPEVETMRRGILPIVGSRVEDFRSGDCAKRPILIAPSPAVFKRRIIGKKITEIGRVGKRVVVHLDSADAMIFEPRMTGLVLLAAPPTIEHLRLKIALSGGKHKELLFWDRRGLGLVRLVTPKEFGALYGLDKLGPDALALTSEELQSRLETSKRPIKVALLDQRALAGVGNLYASEILHLAGVHPERTCDRISRPQWQRIHAAILEVLNLAIRYEGSTLGDGTYRNALNEQGGFQNHHRVYDRAGEVCLGCGKAKIQRIVQAQRSTFFCAHCQKPARKQSSSAVGQ